MDEKIQTPEVKNHFNILISHQILENNPNINNQLAGAREELGTRNNQLSLNMDNIKPV